MKKNTLLILLLTVGIFGFSPPAPEITIEKLSNLIFNESLSIDSIDDVIAQLPDSFKTNYVLMTKSHSLQEGTPENPRVIMFGNSAETFISFNGGADKNKYGGNTLEVIEYDKLSQSYRFAEFIFNPSLNEVRGEQIFKKNSAVAEIRNPHKCIGCHGSSAQDLRVNWDPYPSWPGASTISFLLTDDERKYLEDFIVVGDNNPRYKHLMRQQNLEDVTLRGLETSMAAQLDEKLRAQRRERFLKKIRATKDYVQFKFAIMGALAACPNMEDFVPTEIREALNIKGSRAELEQKTSEMIELTAPEHISLFVLSPEGAHILANLRWLFESRDQSLEYWSTSLQSHFLFTTTPEVFFPPILRALGEEDGIVIPDLLVRILAANPETRVFLSETSQAEHRLFCKTLKDKSVRQKNTPGVLPGAGP